MPGMRLGSYEISKVPRQAIDENLYCVGLHRGRFPP